MNRYIYVALVSLAPCIVLGFGHRRRPMPVYGHEDAPLGSHPGGASS